MKLYYEQIRDWNEWWVSFDENRKYWVEKYYKPIHRCGSILSEGPSAGSFQ